MKWENTLTFKSSFLQRLLLDKTFTFTRLLQFVQNGGDAEIFKTNEISLCYSLNNSYLVPHRFFSKIFVFSISLLAKTLWQLSWTHSHVFNSVDICDPYERPKYEQNFRQKKNCAKTFILLTNNFLVILTQMRNLDNRKRPDKRTKFIFKLNLILTIYFVIIWNKDR